MDAPTCKSKQQIDLKSTKEHIFQGTPFSGSFQIKPMQYGKWKTMLRNSSYVPYLNIAAMEKPWFRPQWSIALWFIAYMEKGWFYQRLFFEIKKIHHK